MTKWKPYRLPWATKFDQMFKNHDASNYFPFFESNRPLSILLLESQETPSTEEPVVSTKFLKVDRTLRPEGCHFDPEVLFERKDEDK